VRGLKLKAQLAGQEHELTLRRDERRVVADIDGRHYELEVSELGNGEYLLLDGICVYNCRLASEERDFFEVYLRGNRYDVRVIDPKRLRGSQSSGGHDPGEAQIVVPMPGKVVRVLVGVGSRVEMGAGIAVVEAMKMQNEMKAPKAGTVVSLRVAPGATVNAGDVLAVIE
jgi:biotin carboxyl carrier protein